MSKLRTFYMRLLIDTEIQNKIKCKLDVSVSVSIYLQHTY